ncbi:MAG: response regulator [Gammaproteobacteria bacterium]|nr:response regulator [Gammaproteobacteria bacterium]
MSSPKNKIQKSILAIDDTPANIILLEQVFSEHYIFQSANSGNNALKIIDQSKPDLILLDIMMPEMNGYELCDILKSDPKTVDIPIIFVSALTSTEEQIKGFEVGAYDYIPKPINVDTLKAKVHLVLDNIENNLLQKKELESSRSTAMTALMALSEIGAVIDYLKSLPLLQTHNEIAEKLISFVQYFNLTAIVRIESGKKKFHYASTKGMVKPLEKTILEKMQTKGTIFDFEKGIFLKKDFISLLVIKMPTDNIDLYERLKDYFLSVIEGTIPFIKLVNSKQKNKIIMEKEQLKNNESKGLIHTIESVLEFIEKEQNRIQLENMNNMSELIQNMEDSFVSLGLSENQEQSLINLVLQTEEKSQRLFDKNIELEQKITILRTLINF